MDNFYITLTSNVKSNFFDEDISNFRTKLASGVNLKGKWEVGLSAISYTNSGYNFNEKEHIDYTFYDPFEMKKKIFKKSVEISINNYPDIKSLLEEIETSRSKAMKTLKLTDASTELPEINIRTKDNRLYFNLKLYNNFLVFPQMSDRLCKILGFDKEILEQKITETYETYTTELTKNPKYTPKHSAREKIFWAPNIFNLKVNYNSMFLYCNLIKDSYINENLEPLLRFIEIPSTANYGDQIVFNYPKCHYIPVRYNEFGSIEVTLKDETDKNFPFRFGNIIIVLHFRKQ